MDRPNRDEAISRRQVGFFDVVMLAAGTAIGVSIFSALGPGAEIAGSGMLLAIPLAMIPMTIFCCVYAFMASVDPRSGASYEWAREYVGPGIAFIVTWLRILGSIGMLVTNALVLVQYWSRIVDLPELPTRFALILVIFLANFRGITVAAKFQTVAMFLLLATLALFVVGGVSHVRLHQIGSPVAMGVLPIILCLPLMVKLFLGIETATEIGEEVRNADRTIPRALFFAVIMTAAIYFVVTVIVLGLLGPERLAASEAPLLDAAALPFGPFAATLVLMAATASLLKSLNSIFLVFSRYLFAMGRSGALPRWLGVADEQTGAPRHATLAAFVCTVLGLALPSDLVFLFIAAIIPTIFKYLSTCLAAFNVPDRRPDLLPPSSPWVSRASVRIVAVAGMVCAAGLLIIGIGTDWRPYLLVLLWGLGGVGYWLVRERRSVAAQSGWPE